MVYDLQRNPQFRCDVFFDGVVHRGLEYPYDQKLFPELPSAELLSRPLEDFHWDTRTTLRYLASDGSDVTIFGGGAYANGAMGCLACFRDTQLSWSIATDCANPIHKISRDNVDTIFAKTTSGHHWQISGLGPAKLLYLAT